MEYVQKELTKNVNVTPHHPLVNFAYLLGTVVVITIVIFVALGFVADFLVTRISPNMESQIGQKLLPTILADNEELVEDKRIQYLNKLINSLPQADETTRLPLTIHLIQSDVINAAITTGGHVLIHTALLENVNSENELAFVLGHELGHFQAYDPLKSLGRTLVFLAALMVLNFDISDTSIFGPDIISTTGSLTYLNYSRKQEGAADFYGLSRIIKYYGHGGHSLDFFVQLLEDEEKEGESKHLQKVSQYFETHPPTEKRITILQELAAENGWIMEGNPTPLPKWLHCPNMEKCSNEE
jgi:predicted Zn-dependent protease